MWDEETILQSKCSLFLAKRKRMAGRLIKNVTNDYLTCPICFQRFKEPKTLPCEHTFCLSCLGCHIEQTHSDGKYLCPVDRREIKMPDGCPDVWACAVNYETDPVIEGFLHVVDKSSDRSPEVTRRGSDFTDFYCFGCKKLVTAESAVQGHKLGSCECIKINKAYKKTLPVIYSYNRELELLLMESERLKKEDKYTVELSESQQEVLQQIQLFDEKMEEFYMSCKEQVGILKSQVLDYKIDEEPSDEINENDKIYEDINEVYMSLNSALDYEDHVEILKAYTSMRPKIDGLRRRLNSHTGKPTRKCSFEFVPNRKALEMVHKRFKFGTLHSIEHTQFIAQQPGDREECNFYDVAVTEQYIIISDGLNNSLKRFLIDGTFIDSISITNPCRIAVVGEGEIAITRFYKRKLTTVTLGRKMHVKDHVRTKKPYVGICSLGQDKFAVTYYDGQESTGIDIINKDGKIYHVYLGHLNSFENAPLFTIPMFVAKTSTGNIVLCDYSEMRNVVCFDNQLNVLWFQRMTSMPCGIACDADNIYVTLPEENKMVVLYQEDGEKLRNIIKPSDRVKRPYAVSFCGRELVVSEDESSKLHIFCL